MLISEINIEKVNTQKNTLQPSKYAKDGTQTNHITHKPTQPANPLIQQTINQLTNLSNNQPMFQPSNYSISQSILYFNNQPFNPQTDR